MAWERIAGGYERNTITGKIRATGKYGKFGKTQKENLKEQIREYVKHYHHPVSDIKGLNKLLKREFGTTITKKQVAEMLNFI